MTTPMTDAELDELIGSTLHGPLPSRTQYRVFATPMELRKQRDMARAESLNAVLGLQKKAVEAPAEVVAEVIEPEQAELLK